MSSQRYTGMIRACVCGCGKRGRGLWVYPASVSGPVCMFVIRVTARRFYSPVMTKNIVLKS